MSRFTGYVCFVEVVDTDISNCGFHSLTLSFAVYVCVRMSLSGRSC